MKTPLLGTKNEGVFSVERFMILGGSSGPRSIGPNMNVYDTARHRMVIDCGSEFLSRTTVRGGNFEALQDEKKIDAVILTHGHLDHIAFVPALEPFLAPDAKIFASPQTHEILGLACADGMRFNPSTITMRGVLAVRDPKRRVDIPVGESEILDGLFVNTVPNGHIPGSFSLGIRLESGEVAHITSDWCFQDQPVVRGAELLSKALPPKWWPRVILGTDLTYGDRERKPWAEELERLRLAIAERTNQGGMSVVCAFQVGRGQNLAIELSKIPNLSPIYVDGGIRKLFRIFQENPWSSHDVTDFTMENIRFVESAAHREELIRSKEPIVVITTSGMASGGPVGSYLERALPSPTDGVFFTSFLAHDSTGQEILRKKERGGNVKIAISPETDEFGEPLKTVELPVNCATEKFSFSAHCDLNDSRKYFADIPEERLDVFRRIVLTHGTTRSKIRGAAVLRKLADEILFGEEGTMIAL